MNRFIYSFLLYLALPFLLLRLLIRARTNKDYGRRINERFAFNLPPLKQQSIWLHTVSVGEAIAAQNLVLSLQQEYPHLPITVTCMTPTGSQTIKRLFGDSVQHCYLPYDLPGVMRRFLRILRPKLAIMLETEIWPNMLNECAKQQIPVVLANGRMSARSKKGYARLGKFTQKTLRKISVIAAQTPIDAARFVELGANSCQIKVTGSLKFDLKLDANIKQQAEQLRMEWQALDRLIWIAASTHIGEDEIMLKAHSQILSKYPNALLILVPRHIERSTNITKLITAHNLTYQKRTAKKQITAQTQVLLGDTLGELMLLYAVSDVAVIGGSFVAHGGHNFLEPAALKLPLLAGEHNFNFAQIAEQMQQAGALTLVKNEFELSNKIAELFSNQKERAQMGKNAFSVLQENSGALPKLLEFIHPLLVQ